MVEPARQLSRTLRRRHMELIALGGVIGAGLFVGSGVVVKSAGPAAIVSFALTGALVVLVMRMLGEMAVAYPAVGGFYEYNRLALGDLAGFLTGWMYWYFWVIVVALVAGACALAVHAGAHEPLHRRESVVGALLRRSRVLVRLDQGRCNRRVPVRRHGVRARRLAGSAGRDRDADGPWGLHA